MPVCWLITKTVNLGKSLLGATLYLKVALFILIAQINTTYAQSNNLQTNQPELTSEQIKTIQNSKRWKRILFYQNRWLSQPTSLVDDSSFFLSPLGKLDPVAEAQATLEAFLKDTGQTKGSSSNASVREMHAQCRFPARLRLFEDLFHISSWPGFKKQPCPNLQEFIEDSESDRLWIVFSSYFPENAGSLFGHTFLKIRPIEKSGSGIKNKLLDLGISYAAIQDTNNPLLYASKGITGGFKGQTSLNPYYMKLQEYNHAEARDLWEYELNFSKAEIELLLLSVWELGHTAVDYFYLDENCSFILLVLLEAARENLNLTAQFNTWVIPVDTLRAVAREPGLIKNSEFMPSNVRTFFARYDLLSKNERITFNSIYRLFKSVHAADTLTEEQKTRIRTSLMEVNAHSQASILDAWVEYLDFKERIAGTGLPNLYQGLRQFLLTQRSSIREASPSLLAISTKPPEYENPLYLHGPITVATGLSYHRTQGSTLTYSWRPAYTDLLNTGRGSPTHLEVRFMEFLFNTPFETRGTSLIRKQGKSVIQLEQWNFLQVVSLNPLHAIHEPISWKIQIGAERSFYCKDLDCFRSQLGGSVGYTLETQKKGQFGAFLFSGFLSSALGLENQTKNQFFLKLGLEPQILYHASRSSFDRRALLSASIAKKFTLRERAKTEAALKFELSQELSNSIEFRLYTKMQQDKAWQCGSELRYSI